MPRGADRGGGGSEDHMTRVNQALEEAAPELKPLMVRLVPPSDAKIGCLYVSLQVIVMRTTYPDLVWVDPVP